MEISNLYEILKNSVRSLPGGSRVKIPEVVNSAVGLKLVDGSLESTVARRISRNSNQLS